jgi:hypothetical protein
MADEEEKTNSEEESQDDKTEDEKTAAGETEGEKDDEEGKGDEDKTEDDSFVDPEKIEVQTRSVEKKKEDDTTTTDDEETEIEPEDKSAIKKVVDESLGPIHAKLARIQKLEDDAEVSGFIATHPEAAKYKGAMLKYIGHSAYSNIPVANIFSIVAANDLQRLGAEKERIAAKKAADTQGGGSTARKPGGSKTDWSTATKEEFDAQKAKVLGRQGA